jgi:uncharacterized protein YodC (DUF2158 family)
MQVGDVVQLKSGGPETTIEERNQQSGRFKCVWFDGKKKEVGMFEASSLKKVG